MTLTYSKNVILEVQRKCITKHLSKIDGLRQPSLSQSAVQQTPGWNSAHYMVTHKYQKFYKLFKIS